MADVLSRHVMGEVDDTVVLAAISPIVYDDDVTLHLNWDRNAHPLMPDDQDSLDDSDSDPLSLINLPLSDVMGRVRADTTQAFNTVPQDEHESRDSLHSLSTAVAPCTTSTGAMRRAVGTQQADTLTRRRLPINANAAFIAAAEVNAVPPQLLESASELAHHGLLMRYQPGRWQRVLKTNGSRGWRH